MWLSVVYLLFLVFLHESEAYFPDFKPETVFFGMEPDIYSKTVFNFDQDSTVISSIERKYKPQTKKNLRFSAWFNKVIESPLYPENKKLKQYYEKQSKKKNQSPTNFKFIADTNSSKKHKNHWLIENFHDFEGHGQTDIKSYYKSINKARPIKYHHRKRKKENVKSNASHKSNDTHHQKRINKTSNSKSKKLQKKKYPISYPIKSKVRRRLMDQPKPNSVALLKHSKKHKKLHYGEKEYLSKHYSKNHKKGYFHKSYLNKFLKGGQKKNSSHKYKQRQVDKNYASHNKKSHLHKHSPHHAKKRHFYINSSSKNSRSRTYHRKNSSKLKKRTHQANHSKKHKRRLLPKRAKKKFEKRTKYKMYKNGHFHKHSKLNGKHSFLKTNEVGSISKKNHENLQFRIPTISIIEDHGDPDDPINSLREFLSSSTSGSTGTGASTAASGASTGKTTAATGTNTGTSAASGSSTAGTSSTKG